MLNSDREVYVTGVLVRNSSPKLRTQLPVSTLLQFVVKLFVGKAAMLSGASSSTSPRDEK